MIPFSASAIDRRQASGRTLTLAVAACLVAGAPAAAAQDSATAVPDSATLAQDSLPIARDSAPVVRDQAAGSRDRAAGARDRTAGAQDRAAVGAQVGYSRADLTGENSDLVESRQGAITGVYLHLPMNRMVSVRPEVLFSLKGGQILALIAGDSDVSLVDIELAYLELPILGRLTLPRGRFRPTVFGGPSVGLQIGCDLEIIRPDSVINVICGENDESGIREWDVGWIAGAAVEMHLPHTTLALQGRYSAGFRSVLEGPVDLRNRGMAVLFGLTF